MNISLSAILEFVKEEEVCYQTGDSLPEFTNNKENLATLLEEISESKNAEITTKEELLKLEPDVFQELVDWSTETDLLIKLDDWVLICIPYTDLVEWCFVEHNQMGGWLNSYQI